MASNLVFNRASDNYLFHGGEFKAGSGCDYLKLSSSGRQSTIDLCNNSNIDISATDVFINGKKVLTSSGTSGSTLGTLVVTETTVLQDLSAGATDISSTLNVAGATTLSSTLDVTGVTTLTGALDANSTADIADTLTLSKGSGTGLSVTADASVGGTLGVTGATTLTGALDANSTADIADTLTLSKGSGTGLSVTADASVGGTLGVTGATTLSSTLGVTGAVQIGSGQNGSLTIGSGVNGGKIHSTATQHELVIDPFALDADRTTEDASGVVTILGNLVVRGNTTTFHSVNVDISDHNLTLASGTSVTAGMADGAGITIGNDSYATFTFDSNNTKWETNIDLDVSGALAVSGALSGATSIDGTGDLTMGTITMTGFSVDADGDTVTKSIDNTSGGITNTGAIAGATTVTASGAVTGGSLTDGTATLASGALSGATSITSTAFVGDLTGDVTGDVTGSSGSCTGNAATATAVKKSSFTIVKSSLGDLSEVNAQGGGTFVGSSGDGDYQDATNYTASRTVISGDSCIKMEFKVNFISSPEADQTLSFRVRRNIGGTITTVFTDENIGSNMGITFRNVYNGTFIDDLSESIVADDASVSYQLQYKRNCPSGDTISTNFGIVDGGNYIYLQELYA